MSNRPLEFSMQRPFDRVRGPWGWGRPRGRAALGVGGEWGVRGPLNIGEMERAMQYDVDYTEAEGVTMQPNTLSIFGQANVGFGMPE